MGEDLVMDNMPSEVIVMMTSLFEKGNIVDTFI